MPGQSIPHGPTNVRAVNFSVALELIKDGEAMTRAGWSGRHYVRLHRGTITTPEQPQVGLEAFIALYPRGQRKNVVPWTASQTDLLANDWEVY